MKSSSGKRLAAPLRLRRPERETQAALRGDLAAADQVARDFRDRVRPADHDVERDAGREALAEQLGQRHLAPGVDGPDALLERAAAAAAEHVDLGAGRGVLDAQ